MKKRADNPRDHRGTRVSFSREPASLKVWSYQRGKKSGREYHVAFVVEGKHTICQGSFTVMKP